MAAQFRERRTLSHQERGRCSIQEGEDAVPRRTLSRSVQGKRCPGEGRTLISLGVRTLSISGGGGCRSEGQLSDPTLEGADLSRYMQI